MDFVPSRFLGEIPRELVEMAGESRGMSRADDDGGYPAGSVVYHDDYGTGVVTRAFRSGGELVVQVQFESGRVARFLPKYTPLEKVAGDVD